MALIATPHHPATNKKTAANCCCSKLINKEYVNNVLTPRTLELQSNIEVRHYWDAILLPVEREQIMEEEDYLQIPRGTLKRILVLLSIFLTQ